MKQLTTPWIFRFFEPLYITRKISIVWIVLAILLCMGLWTARNIYVDYHNTLVQNYRLLEVRAKQHEARIVSALHHIDATFRNITHDIEIHDTKKSLLDQHIDYLPEVKALFITDGKGRIVVSTVPDFVGFNGEKREYFYAHYDKQSSHAPHISKPFKTAKGYMAFTVSRMLSDKNGVFQGTLVAILEPSYFNTALKPDSNDGSLAITLVHRSGDILCRYPSVNSVGKNLQGGPAFDTHIVSLDNTTHHLVHAKLENIKKMSVFHTLQDFPLIVVAAENYDDLMGTWYQNILFHIASLVLLALMIFFLLRLAMKQKAFVQDALDSISSQIAVIDHRGVIIEVNSTWRRFSMENSLQSGEMTPHTDVGTNYLEVTCPTKGQDNESDYICTGIKAVLTGDSKNFTYEYPCHSPHEERWFSMSVTPLYSDKGSAVIVHSNITERKLSEIKVRNLAFYDVLTGLPNRRLLNDRLAVALSSSRRLKRYGALMMLDLDNFKSLNDTHGHAFGDLLLIEVSRRLTANVREVDTVARFGGDEFIVLLGALEHDADTSQKYALAIAEKIRLSLCSPYQLSVENESGTIITHHCSCSIGMVLFNEHDVKQDDLFKHADQAMYRAKEAGRNKVDISTKN